jgi:hypothetical protein
MGIIELPYKDCIEQCKDGYSFILNKHSKYGHQESSYFRSDSDLTCMRIKFRFEYNLEEILSKYEMCQKLLSFLEDNRLLLLKILSD